MAKIPTHLQAYIDDAFPKNVILVGTVLDDGYAQVSPRGSVLVWDDETLAFWDRGRGLTHDTVQNGTKLTFYFRNTDLRDDGTLPKGGIARFYGAAELHLDGAVRDGVYDKMKPPERDRDPDKAGSAVLVKIARSEDLSGDPLTGS
jgi:hypothetical protein